MPLFVTSALLRLTKCSVLNSSIIALLFRKRVGRVTQEIIDYGLDLLNLLQLSL